MSEHILDKPIRGIAKAVRQGKMSFEEVMSEAVARHARHDDALQAYKYFDGDGAIEAARSADTFLAQGHDVGPLMGLPISAKDIFGVTGEERRVG